LLLRERRKDRPPLASHKQKPPASNGNRRQRQPNGLLRGTARMAGTVSGPGSHTTVPHSDHSATPRAQTHRAHCPACTPNVQPRQQQQCSAVQCRSPAESATPTARVGWQAGQNLPQRLMVVMATHSTAATDTQSKKQPQHRLETPNRHPTATSALGRFPSRVRKPQPPEERANHKTRRGHTITPPQGLNLKPVNPEGSKPRTPFCRSRHRTGQQSEAKAVRSKSRDPACPTHASQPCHLEPVPHHWCLLAADSRPQTAGRAAAALFLIISTHPPCMPESNTAPSPPTLAIALHATLYTVDTQA
jgi:hypothetical protein